MSRQPTARIALGGAGEAHADADRTFYRDDLRLLVRTGRLLAMFGRYRDASIETDDVRFPRAPVLAPLIGRWLSPRAVRYVDRSGAARRLTIAWHVSAVACLLRDVASIPGMRRRLARELASVEAGAARTPTALRPGRVAYLRTDLIFGLRAGGSVGHVAGVVNNLSSCGFAPVFVTPDPVPTVSPSIPVRVVLPDERFWDFRAIPRQHYNLTFERSVTAMFATDPVSWVYHRLSLGSFAAALVAVRGEVPLVVEYNGSEVWAEQHWGGGGVDRSDLRIETAVLSVADVVVVVSEPLRDELLARGIGSERILVNPNGVDVERYHPDVAPAAVRATIPEDAVVIGFIGTFGPWHGAEVLAEAFREVRRIVTVPVHLLMIGDGSRRAATEAILREPSTRSHVTFTGVVQQTEGPAHLAACDVLIAPHVPNEDGSPFFGSPTKLFEYMAMGRCIVASRLDQIGDVLRHDETALLVEPAKPRDLAAAIASVAGDAALRRRLGAAARADAVAHHTWAEHTRRICDALRQRCEGGTGTA